MGTSVKRVAYIQSHYAINQTPEGWEAVSFKADGVTRDSVHSAATRAEVCRLARCWWGHFNFEDEAEAFSAIFKP